MVVIKCVLCAVEKEYNYKYCFKDMENRERPQVTKNCTGILIKKRTPNEKEISYVGTPLGSTHEVNKRSQILPAALFAGKITHVRARCCHFLCVCVYEHTTRVLFVESVRHAA